MHNPDLTTINPNPDWWGTPIDQTGRFVNLSHPYVASLWQVIRWQLQTNPYKAQKKKETYQPLVADDPGWLSTREDVLVWLGHSTFYLRINGVQLLTDPVFGDILTVKRQSPFPIDPRLFDRLDYVLLSHDHRDHLDIKSLRLLATHNPDVTYLAGLGSTNLLTRITRSKAIQTAGWYQQFTTNEQAIKLTFVPARHWARRGLFDTNRRLWGGFVVEAAGKRIFFGGDSGYNDHYQEIGALFGGFDYALLGIGAYEPRWFSLCAPCINHPPRPYRPFSRSMPGT